MSITENVTAREDAKEAVSLVLQFCSEAGMSPDGVRRYLQDVRDMMTEFIGDQKPQVVVKHEQPMTDEEKRRFECSEMQFGLYQERQVGHVPLDWLVWLDKQPDFRRQLRRYLKRDDMQRFIEQEDL